MREASTTGVGLSVGVVGVPWGDVVLGDGSAGSHLRTLFLLLPAGMLG